MVVLELGDRVEAHSLSGYAHLNGMVGIVCATQGERIGVDFGSPEGVKALKPENLMHSDKGQLPVTLLSGFLGAGKTTLLTHILTNRGGLRVAILVNDMASINIDEELLKENVQLSESKDKMVELHNGCICCTLREDLVKSVRELANEKRFDYLIIESTGISEPLPVAFTFDAEENGKKLLGDVARMDTCVTVVDCLNFLKDYQSQEKAVDRKDLGAEEGDARTIVDLLTDQVEFANVLILNKTDLVSPEQLGKLKGILKKLNPGARLIESEYGVVEPEKLLNTKTFDVKSSKMLAGWQAELSGVVPHTPETEEYGISSFIYRRDDRPFHPDRLEKVLEAGSLPGVLRSKGFTWIASEHLFAVEWSQAGCITTLGASARWRMKWPKEGAEKYKDRELGCRRHELVFIGNAMDEAKLRELLDGALLTDEEFALGPEAWTNWKKYVTDQIIAPEDASKDKEYTIEIRKAASDERWGVQVDETEGVRVSFVNPGGLFDKWNTQNPDAPVKVGYEILEVNGTKGVAGMKLLASTQVAQFKLSRLQMIMKNRRFPDDGKQDHDDHQHHHHDDHHGHSHGGYNK